MRADAPSPSAWICAIPIASSPASRRRCGTLGGLDIVVNNAALLVPGTLDQQKQRHIDLLWEINLRGLIYLTREALPHMRTRGGGRIINVSSRGAVFPGPGPYPSDARKGGWLYGGLKAALERMSQGWAIDLQEDSISVNVLSPEGRILTPGALFASSDPDNPNLDFEPAEKMGKGAVGSREQPPTFTGHILFDEQLCEEQGL
ncbi:MAG: SDR family oxidoreductase [Dehalococcoidia bacterium]|nr:SDR family oxidoreductase [Dehalococcoidia bacterium]